MLSGQMIVATALSETIDAARDVPDGQESRYWAQGQRSFLVADQGCLGA
jgi:hypothetical protein